MGSAGRKMLGLPVFFTHGVVCGGSVLLTGMEVDAGGTVVCTATEKTDLTASMAPQGIGTLIYS